MRLLFVTLLLLSLAAAVFAAGNPAVGSWKLVSSSPDGGEHSWTLVIKEVDGKLTGTISGAEGEFTFTELKCEEGVLTGKLAVDAVYKIEARINGDKLEGKYEGDNGASGTLKATRGA